MTHTGLPDAETVRPQSKVGSYLARLTVAAAGGIRARIQGRSPARGDMTCGRKHEGSLR